MAHSPEGQRGIIIGLREAGFTEEQIRNHPHVTLVRTQIKQWISRHRDEGFHGFETRPRSGRPKVVADEDALLIRATVMARPFSSLREVVQELTPHLQPHMRSVYDRVRKEKLRCCTAAEKPLLTDAQKDVRLQFAHDHVNDPVELWRASPVSDEKSYRSDQSRSMKVWRLRGQRYEPEFTTARTASGRVTAMMWDAVSAEHGSLAFVECPPRMTSIFYRDNCLAPFLETMRGHVGDAEIRFTQDNAPIHTARAVKEWLQDHPQIQKMNWPPMSPDLHWIENVWGLVALNWSTRREVNRADLVAHARDDWDWVTGRAHILQRLADSMPDRLQEIIDKNGGATHY